MNKLMHRICHRNDWRAIEAGAHAMLPDMADILLSEWKKDENGDLIGSMNYH